MVNHWCEICVASSRPSICAVLSCRSSICALVADHPQKLKTVRRRTFSTALAYQFSSHPRIRLNCLHLLTFQALTPSTENLDIITFKRRDYLSLITWTSHYHWSIKSRHFLWVKLLQVSTAFEQTLVTKLQISHNLITILHLKLLAQKFLLLCGRDWTLFYSYFSNFTLQWQKVWKIMEFFFVFSVHLGKKKQQNCEKNIAKLSKPQILKNETLVKML
jgi:hypothetical protein